ncbi:hypothetical protein KKP04_05755 [Rhodomicrobium sp. Az07]|uniref:hypothetical protein n=1 Tax=Rhodomicrobium sp. Az07 TaxID=2839034 RepID=UPI001BE88C8D|nr:hypothetical protein [Rhodomicrobium sp. Az07]MBT3070371.1 hypothetical protein [Rhodomicrobium sp. Az07]
MTASIFFMTDRFLRTGRKSLSGVASIARAKHLHSLTTKVKACETMPFCQKSRRIARKLRNEPESIARAAGAARTARLKEAAILPPKWMQAFTSRFRKDRFSFTLRKFSLHSPHKSLY